METIKVIFNRKVLNETIELVSLGVPLLKIIRQHNLYGVSRPTIEKYLRFYSDLKPMLEKRTEPKELYSYLPKGFPYDDMPKIFTDCKGDIKKFKTSLADTGCHVAQAYTDLMLNNIMNSCSIIYKSDTASDAVRECLFPKDIDMKNKSIMKLNKKFTGVYPIGIWV